MDASNGSSLVFETFVPLVFQIKVFVKLGKLRMAINKLFIYLHVLVRAMQS